MRLSRVCVAFALVALVAIAGCGDDGAPLGVPGLDAATAAGGADPAGLDAAAMEEEPVTEKSPIELMQVEAGDWTFEVRVAGPADGTPVWLLHGFPQTGHEYRAQLVALADAGYRAFAPDQRGYSPGAQPQALEAYETEKLAADVIAMADAMGHDRFHLVGHDWGAAVAWLTAATYGDRLLSLTTLSVGHLDAVAEALADPSSGQTEMFGYQDFFRMEGSEATLLANDAAIMRQVYTGIDAQDVEVYLSVLGDEKTLGLALNWYRASPFEDRTPLGSIDVPTLFIWSDADTALGRVQADLTEKYVSAAYELKVIEGVSHWLPDLAPDQVNTHLLAHLGSN